MWEERYNTEEYVFGKKPNAFLESVIDSVGSCRTLDVGAGEGRNAVFLATKGFEVTVLDGSQNGLNKAVKLAAENNVKLQTIHAELNTYKFPDQQYDLIVMFFCHLPPELRVKVFSGITSTLKPGGKFIMEMFSMDQLKHIDGGGPKDPEWLLSIEKIRTELPGFKFIKLQETSRDMTEGRKIERFGEVIQVIAEKL